MPRCGALRCPLRCVLAIAWIGLSTTAGLADEPQGQTLQRIDASAFEPLVEPPCSYCSTQHLKGILRADDPVVCWLRGRHNGGAAPLRHFLAAPRVINDTYGIFFYDPDGGYVAVYERDYGYKFVGTRDGVMVVEGPDGTLWSALTGVAFEGPKQGARLRRVPSLTTTWGYWLMLHPESTAYDLYDGDRYEVAELPTELSPAARTAITAADKRAAPLTPVLGVEVGSVRKAYSLDGNVARACIVDELAGEPIAVFWYGPTATAAAFSRRVDGRVLNFEADPIAPESAPFADRETGSRWTLAGRAVDGPLRGRELQWVDSIQCRWYAWSNENPKTLFHDPQP